MSAAMGPPTSTRVFFLPQLARVARMGSHYSTAEAGIHDQEGSLVASSHGAYPTTPRQ